jgi:hypothetical protein
MEIWGGNYGICQIFWPLPLRDLGWDLIEFNYLLFFFSSKFLYGSMSSMVVACGVDGICQNFFFPEFVYEQNGRHL